MQTLESATRETLPCWWRGMNGVILLAVKVFVAMTSVMDVAGDASAVTCHARWNVEEKNILVYHKAFQLVFFYQLSHLAARHCLL